MAGVPPNKNKNKKRSWDACPGAAASGNSACVAGVRGPLRTRDSCRPERVYFGISEFIFRSRSVFWDLGVYFGISEFIWGSRSLFLDLGVYFGISESIMGTRCLSFRSRSVFWDLGAYSLDLGVYFWISESIFRSRLPRSGLAHHRADRRQLRRADEVRGRAARERGVIQLWPMQL